MARLIQIAEHMPVTDYRDYREYLEALFLATKSDAKKYSYLNFAEDLGFSATNVIRLVVVGKRRLSLRSAKTIVKTLGLRNAERKYFLASVEMDNARTQATRDVVMSKLLDAKEAASQSPSSKMLIRYFSEWYYPAIREVCRMKNGPKELAQLQKRFYGVLSPKKVQEAIEHLEAMGLVTLDSKQRRIVAISDEELVLPSAATVGHVSVERFHQSVSDLAKAAIARVPDDQREFNALTLCINEDEFENIKGEIRDLCQKAMQRDRGARSKDRVVQLNIQLFNITKPEGDYDVD